ncbi:MAG: amidohydrolase [Clostridia bacterium]|nr:amidohydrolase [Clostridia bacterium]
MKKYYDLVEKNKQLVLDAEKYIWENPEPGYKEFKTNAYMLEQFEKLGYTDIVKAENCTGFYTVLDTGRVGPTVLIMAELDSLINTTHPACDKETGAVHSCGHHAQCAAMLGLAAALKEEGAIDNLCGKIKLCLVPAEEGIEIGYRKGLIQKGIIEFTSGKPEFIARRYFDDIDIAFMLHSTSNKNEKLNFILTRGHNGVIRKRTIVKGKSAHAGGRPHEGINALNAASLIMMAINSLRETFKEEYYARVHSIITKGGDAVNAVPDEVIIESYVRAAEPIAHKMVNDSVNRAISAAAAAIGCTVLIEDMAGSEALNEDANLREVALEVFEEIAGKEGYQYDSEWLASSTDMGDISSLVPAIHMYSTGAVGTSHGIDMFIKDPYKCCVNGAKAELGVLVKLLENNAQRAKDIIAKFKPTFNSVDEYLAHKRSINMEKDTVIMNEDGTITLDYKG